MDGWQPPFIPVEVGRITTRLTVSDDLFLAKLTGTEPGISREVQLVDILLRFILTLIINLCLLSQRQFA